MLPQFGCEPPGLLFFLFLELYEDGLHILHVLLHPRSPAAFVFVSHLS